MDSEDIGCFDMLWGVIATICWGGVFFVVIYILGNL